MKGSLLALFCCLFFTSLFGQGAKYGNDFLNIGSDARGHAMGQSTFTRVGGGSPGFWNPALLPDLQQPATLSFMHAEWMGSIAKYDFLGFSRKINARTGIGLSIIRFGIDNIPNTLFLMNSDGSFNFQNISAFSAVDYAFLFSFGKKMKNDKVSIGFASKVLRRNAGDFGSAWGFGLDASLLYAPFKNWKITLIGKDISTTFNSWNYTFTDDEKEILRLTQNDIPISSFETILPSFVLGNGFSGNLGKSISICLETALWINMDGKRNVMWNTPYFNIDPGAGIELGLKETVYLRGGVGQFQYFLGEDMMDELSFQPNFGIGLSLGRFNLDYAMTDVGDRSEVLYSHMVSLSFSMSSDDLSRSGLLRKKR